jgi:arginyl-tRNA synthetase
VAPTPEEAAILGIAFDEIRGESAYEGAMPGVLAMLAEKGLTSISQDALVVDLTAEGMPPCLLRKNDGATLYATRDLSAAIYRWNTYHFVRSLYVVDKGQSLHFKQFFTVLAKAGFEWAQRLQHVPFGLVRIGGKKAGNRSGNVVLLKEVLAEAQSKIAARLGDMPEAQRQQVAREVGIGAILFANLAAQREKDVDFDMDQVTSFEGDAGPYVQYAHARAASVLRKAGVTELAGLASADFARLVRPEEWALARILSELPDVTVRAADGLEPHLAARDLLDVCAAYSRWYAAGNQDATARVLVDDEALRRARLGLTAMTKITLAHGLGLLGMAAPEAM